MGTGMKTVRIRGRRGDGFGAYGRPIPFRQFFLLALLALADLSGFAEARDIKLIALGDSLTAGYNLPAQQAFPAVLQKALREKGYGGVIVVNAGVSGDTSAGLLDRLDWTLADGADGAIVEIGANDMLRGLNPQQTEQNIDAILQKLRARKIPFLLAGMKAAPNLGDAYANDFNAVYGRLAQKYDAAFYPFFLDGVAGVPQRQLADGVHPNAEGVQLMVEKILPSVTAWLEKIESK